MPCYHPLKGVRGGVNSNGKRPLLFDVKLVDCSSQLPTLVPCGQCVGCRLEYSRQWAMRCLDEVKMHKENSFITLTYDDAHLPVDKSLDKRVFQLFMKRLRKALDKKVRYFHAGEYGERYGRPHYHALIFGHAFNDRKFLKRTGSGFNIYTSNELASCWPFGYSSVGDVTFESAAYVARYCMDKIKISEASNDVMQKKYEARYVDKRSGVVRIPEYTTMSRRPGIGYRFFQKYRSDMYPFGTKVVNGVEVKTPRYYDSLYEAESPQAFAELKSKRNSLINVIENSMMRLLVKEEVTLNKIAKLKRELEYV